MQKAEVACPTEPLGQHVLQYQPQELRAGNGPEFLFPRFGVAITETHLAVVTSDDILFGDDAPVKVAPEVDEGLFAPWRSRE